MKTIKIGLLLVVIAIFAVACNSSSGEVKQVDYETVEELFNEDNEGYLLVYLDDDNKYLNELEELAVENKKTVLLYDPYKKDGEKENNKPVYPDEDVRGNVLYYIENGEIKKEVDVNVYERAELKSEIEYLFEK